MNTESTDFPSFLSMLSTQAVKGGGSILRLKGEINFFVLRLDRQLFESYALWLGLDHIYCQPPFLHRHLSK